MSAISRTKLDVIAYCPKEPLKGSATGWDGKQPDCLHLGLWWGCITLAHLIFKILGLGLNKHITFIQVNHQASFLQPCKQGLYVIKVVLLGGVIYDHIVDIDDAVWYIIHFPVH